MREGKELKALHHASTTALYNDHVTTYNIIPNRKSYLKKIKDKFTEELILKIYRLELLIKVKMDLLDFILRVYIV